MEKIGINLRSLLDGELCQNVDFYDYDERNEFISMLEKRIAECDWISMSNGTTFTKSFNAKK